MTVQNVSRPMSCASCEVRWYSAIGECCWVCGEQGVSAGELRNPCLPRPRR